MGLTWGHDVIQTCPSNKALTGTGCVLTPPFSRSSSSAFSGIHSGAADHPGHSSQSPACYIAQRLEVTHTPSPQPLAHLRLPYAVSGGGSCFSILKALENKRHNSCARTALWRPSAKLQCLTLCDSQGSWGTGCQNDLEVRDERFPRSLQQLVRLFGGSGFGAGP